MVSKESNSATAIKKLSALHDMLGCLEEVTRLEASALSTEDTKALVALRERVERQLEKVRRNEFHIAVVGLEKAGKSTFLNAWLRHDLLPNAQERCTYATTELRSSETQGSHELLIEYLDRAQFEQDVKRYKEIAASGLAEARGAEADLEEIHHFGKTLQGLLGRERERLTYASLDEMRPHLQRFVANPEVARALRSVTLRSAQLYHKSGVVFHDVPGYDSPISMHQALAREELARADAILFVTNLAANTSLTRDQLRMLEVADAEDPELKARDKLFVFLNKIDGAGSKSDLMERIEKAKQQWCHGPQQCKPERVIPGSAGAYLLTQCSPVQEKTRAMLEAAPGRLRELDAPHGDGIEHLRTQVEHYLEHERAGLLARRHEALVDQGMTLAQRVLSTLSSGYPTSLAELDIADRVERDSAIHDWLDSQWARFQSEFATYWNRSVMPAASDDEPQQLNTDFQRVKTAYSEALGSLKAQLNDANLRPTLSSIHDRIRQQYATPVEANLELRRQLSDRIIAPSLEQVTEQMASTFLLQFERIGEKVSELFFGLESVRKHVLPGEVAAYQDQLSLGFSTLFLRNARPCLTLMLQKPRGKVFRQRMMDIYRPEALSLQSFYDNPAHPERADLPRFLLGAPMLPPQGVTVATKTGAEILKPMAGPAAPLVDPLANSFEEALKQQYASTKHVAETIDQVESEISEDCELLVDYLEHAVYRAAGFEQYCIAELLRVRQHLLGERSDGTRRGIFREIRLAIERRDPRLPAAVKQLADTTHRRHVVEALDRLRSGLHSLSAVRHLQELSA